jgi:uncharacterized protein
VRQPPSIDSFGAGGFRVSGVWRPGSLLLLEDEPFSWRPTTLSDVTARDFDAVIERGRASSEFVLLGTGVTHSLPPREVRDCLRAAGLGLEFMSTEAAARTYRVLMSEGRRVAVALVAV